MTASGCATERHFSSKDLRRLFELMPAGVCEMLNKVHNNVQLDAKGSSGKRSVLEAHEKVVGVSSHDMVYNKSVVDISGEERYAKTTESPFAGTPQKKVRNKRLSSDVRNDAVPLGNGRTQNRDNGKENTKPPLPFNLTKEVNERPSPIMKERTNNIEFQLEKNAKKGFSDIMKDVDGLTRSEKIEESLLPLFSLLKSHDLLKSEKMMVHQKIASRVSYLGWI